MKQRYVRYAKKLKSVRTLDDLLEVNTTELGDVFTGGEHVVTGAVFGYCSGAAVRIVSRSLAVIVGLSFAGLQYLVR